MSWMIYDHLTMWPLDHIHMTVWPGDWSDEWTKYTARQGDMKWKKILKDSRWCDKNGLNESFKMSPHLICLNWGINFHITSRPDPEAGHKRDLRPQLRHIKWGLILKLSMRLFSWHSPKSLRIFSISSLSAALWKLAWRVCSRYKIFQGQCQLVKTHFHFNSHRSTLFKKVAKNNFLLTIL